MSIKKNTLATLLLISLTACSSGGNSSSNTAKSELSSAQNELSTAKQQLTTAQAELTQAQADKATTASQLATAQANLEKAEQAKTAAENQLAAANQQKQAVQNQLNTAKSELSKAQNELGTAKQQLTTAQAELTQAQADKATTASQLATAQANLGKAEQEKTAAEKQLAASNQQKQAVENQLNTAKSELSTAKRQLTTAQAELTQAQADKATTASQLATAQANLEKAEQAKTEAEGALDNKNKVVAEIVKKAKEALESKGYESERININIWSDSDTANLIKGEIIKSPYIHLTTDSVDGIFVGNQYIYLSPNSDMKLYSRTLTAIWSDSELNSMEKSFRVDAYGTRTTTLPQGTATYQGKAFAASASGDLNYQVDFGAKTGSGSIQNFNVAIPTIRLEQGDITSRGVGENHRIRAVANTEDGLNGRYFLDFYGENAESIAGKLYMYSRFENVPASNGREANDFNANERGTVFGLVGERQ